tara:strand:- start:91 stop:231 length:141 start_codon:yes stop_codon:yes gene_type:complete
MITIELKDVSELVVMKNALVNYKKAPFLSNSEETLVEKLLTKLNKL